MNLLHFKNWLLYLVLFFGPTAMLYAQIENSKEDNREGLVYEIELGYLIGGSGSVYFFTYNSALNLNIAVGKRLNEYASINGLIGIENNQDGILFPLAIDLKKYFGSRKNLFFEAHAGYSLGRLKNGSSSFSYKGGPLGGIAIGFNLLKIKQTVVYTQLGYKLRQSSIHFQPFDTSQTISSKLDNHFIGLQFGVQF